MLYSMTKESCEALGLLIAAAGARCAEVEITEVAITISLSDVQKKAAKKPAEPKKTQAKNVSKAKITKSGGKEFVEYNGVKLTRDEWAKKLGVSLRSISYRITLHGSPYGSKDPSGTDKDKIISSTK